MNNEINFLSQHLSQAETNIENQTKTYKILLQNIDTLQKELSTKTDITKTLTESKY